MRFMKLDLRSPLYFGNPIPSSPFPEAFMKAFFEAAAEHDECLALFELDSGTAVSLSPDPSSYLRLPTAFGASSAHQATANAARIGTRLALSAGLYLFIQLPGAVSLDQLTAEAIELQKEGIWNGENLSPVLYLRVLSEEQGLVHQLLRPVSGKDRGA